jgi:3-oxoacyl-[acyl-carrier protein] reductase
VSVDATLGLVALDPSYPKATVMDTSLVDKTAIVCGSTQGIGQAAAVALAAVGAHVVLLARDEEALRRVVSELPTDQGQSHGFMVADFASADNVRDCITEFTASGKIAEILINNSGGPPAGTAIDADVEEFVQALNNHLLCNHHLVQALVPGMKANGYGRIVNVISTSVKQPIPGLGVSNTIRGAVASWAKTLASELGPFGITVNNVLPGFTSTARLASLITSKAQNENASEEAIIAAMEASIPARRFADPAEVAAVIAFLCTTAASYVNGVNLPVDGGRTTCL